MSISSVSFSSSLTQTDWRDVISQWKQDFKQLASSLQSGDLSGAQQAYAALQQLQQSVQPRGQSSNGQQASSNNSIQNDFAALGQALGNGDLSTAQSAFSQLQTDMLAAAQNGASGAVQSAHHGHHHHHASSATDSDSSTADQTASTSSSGSQSAPTGSTFSIYA